MQFYEDPNNKIITNIKRRLHFIWIAMWWTSFQDFESLKG